MKKYLLLGVGFAVAAVACFMPAVKPMVITWDGQNGRILDHQVIDSRRVDYAKFAYFITISDLNRVGIRSMQLIQQPGRSNNGVGIIEVYW